MNSQTVVPIRNLFSGVNQPVDLDNLTDLEKKHIPVIESPSTVNRGECFSVSVEVGKMLTHPNKRDAIRISSLANLDFVYKLSTDHTVFWQNLM